MKMIKKDYLKKLSEEEKDMKREYGRNRYDNMLDEKKTAIKKISKKLS